MTLVIINLIMLVYSYLFTAVYLPCNYSSLVDFIFKLNICNLTLNITCLVHSPLFLILLVYILCLYQYLYVFYNLLI